MNDGLQEQIRELGQSPSEELSIKYEEEEENAWDQIEDDINELKQLIEKAPASSRNYARFLFLYNSDLGDGHKTYERKFDNCIESKLVRPGSDSIYRLNEDHPRSIKTTSLRKKIFREFKKYEGQDDEDSLNYRLNDAEFWKNNIGYYVL